MGRRGAEGAEGGIPCPEVTAGRKCSNHGASPSKSRRVDLPVDSAWNLPPDRG